MRYFFTLLCIGILLHAGAQNRRPVNPQLKELMDQTDQQILAEKLKTLEASTKEEDVSLLASYYTATKKTDEATKINKLVLERFPNGAAAFNQVSEEIYNEKNPQANEKRYQAMVARFGGNPDFRKRFDASRYFVAVTFLGKNNPAKVLEYLNMIQDTVYKTNAYSYAAREAIGTGDHGLGEKLIRVTFSDLARRNTPRPQGYLEYARIASQLLFLNGKYEEGFPYAKDAYDNYQVWKDVNPTYLNYLVALHRLKEAYPMMETAISTGAASPTVKAAFKDAYVAVNGSDKGYSEAEAALQVKMKETITAGLAKKMINQPAFNFALKDFSGKTVSLADYKGKVVILDFWATWCGPCKASFPNMQLAVNKYKNDPNVVFLFIHTWETSPTPAKDAESYIKDKKYTFHVLMDTKDPATKVNSAAAGYKFQGIPAKFIIDKAGNIRFSTLGGSAAGDDAFVEEISTMIELAKAA